MKAAIVTAPGKTPIYGDFNTPTTQPGQELISVRAAALSNFTKGRASGAHYSSAGIFPAIAGTDGVGLTATGRRVYFALPEPPFGSLAEICPVDSRRCVEIPHSLDDITAAAIANPGMSAWAALVDRAKLVPGETVLVNGATGTAGRVAVQLAKFLGAAKVIVTGRNPAELESLKQIGADISIPFALDKSEAQPNGAADFEAALAPLVANGLNVVIDYLWGQSAKTIIVAIAKNAPEAHPVRFVQIGTAAREDTIDLPGAALRAAALTLMGSGVGSVSRAALLHGIKKVFEAVEPAGLKIATAEVPLSEIETTWDKAATKPRIVFTIP